MIRILMALGLLLSLWGCGNDIGDHCDRDDDCPNLCHTGARFPDGICTRSCNDTGECPDGYSCVTTSGGICLLDCGLDNECTDPLGTGWACNDESLEEGGGTARVCIGNS